jgi:hypothetical protein
MTMEKSFRPRTENWPELVTPNPLLQAYLASRDPVEVMISGLTKKTADATLYVEVYRLLRLAELTDELNTSDPAFIHAAKIEISDYWKAHPKQALGLLLSGHSIRRYHPGRS